MKAVDEILEVLENMTLAELQDELELAENNETEYSPVLKGLLLAELENRVK